MGKSTSELSRLDESATWVNGEVLHGAADAKRWVASLGLWGTGIDDGRACVRYARSKRAAARHVRAAARPYSARRNSPSWAGSRKNGTPSTHGPCVPEKSTRAKSMPAAAAAAASPGASPT